MSMFNLIATLRVLPESPEEDLGKIEQSIKKLIPSHMQLHAVEQEPIAFGLVALKVIILTTDSKEGDITPVEEGIQALDGVSQVEVIDVRRTLG